MMEWRPLLKGNTDYFMNEAGYMIVKSTMNLTENDELEPVYIILRINKDGQYPIRNYNTGQYTYVNAQVIWDEVFKDKKEKTVFDETRIKRIYETSRQYNRIYFF